MWHCLRKVFHLYYGTWHLYADHILPQDYFCRQLVEHWHCLDAFLEYAFVLLLFVPNILLEDALSFFLPVVTKLVPTFLAIDAWDLVRAWMFGLSGWNHSGTSWLERSFFFTKWESSPSWACKSLKARPDTLGTLCFSTFFCKIKNGRGSPFTVVLQQFSSDPELQLMHYAGSYTRENSQTA